MEYPKILYKYTRSCHAQKLLRMGTFRIGTLYDYRKGEHGAAISDIDEAKLSPSTHIDNEYWKRETRPELRRFINVSQSASVTVLNSDFKSKVQSKNHYLYCFSDKFCTNLYDDFQADTCVAIINPKKFLTMMSASIQPFINPKKGSLSRIQYVNRSATHRELENCHPALVKGLSFKNQSEYRCLWQPIASEPQPFITGNYRIIEFCRLHHTILKS